MPPSATAPVYKEKVYVKALRMPMEIELKFKNDDYFSKKKTEAKSKNVDLLSSSSKDENVNEPVKFNSANGKAAAGQVKNNNKSDSFEDKKANKGNDLHNLINGGSEKSESENKKKVNKEEKDNDLEFTFHNRNTFLFSLI